MTSEIKKKGFLVYYDNEVIILRLSDDEAGKLFKSLFPYGKEKIKPSFENSPALAMAFDIMRMAIDRDEEKYLRRCETNRKNGRMGGLAKSSNSKQLLANGKQGLANLADMDMDMEKDMDIEKDMDNSITCPEPDKSAPDPSGILLPLNDNTYYDVPRESINKWHEAYPAVDVEQQLKKMIAWLDANPKRRKTRRGINAFIITWLSKEQDKGGIYRSGGSRQQETAPVNNELPPEYQEMYAKYLGKNPPDPDAPFQ